MRRSLLSLRVALTLVVSAYPLTAQIARVAGPVAQEASANVSSPAATEKANALLERGLQQRARQQLAAAAATFEAGIATAPDHTDLHVELAMTKAWQGEHGLALDYFSLALKLQPEHRGAHFGRARVLVWAGRHNDAEQRYHELHRKYPDDLEPLRGLALVYRERLEFAKARNLYSSVLAAEPEDAESLDALQAMAKEVRWQMEVELGATSYGTPTNVLSGRASVAHRWTRELTPYAVYNALLATGLGGSIATSGQGIVHTGQSGVIYRLNQYWTLDPGYQIRVEPDKVTHLLSLRASRSFPSNWVALAGIRPGRGTTGQTELLVDLGLQALTPHNTWLMLQGFAYSESSGTRTQSVVGTGNWDFSGSGSLRLGSAAGRVFSETVVSSFASLNLGIDATQQLRLSYEQLVYGGIRRTAQATWIATL